MRRLNVGSFRLENPVARRLSFCLSLLLLLLGGLATAGATSAQSPDDPPEQQPYAVAELPARIEAEHFDLGGPGVSFDDTDGAFGNVAVDESDPTNAVDVWTIDRSGASGALIGRTRANEYVEYTVSVAESAEFDVQLRLASGDSAKFVHVAIDGESLSTVHGSTGRWFGWQTRSAGTVTLAPGDHVVRVTWARGGNVNFDWLEFVATDRAAGCQRIVEAEDATLSGRFVTVESPAASGNAHVEVPHGSGGWWNGVSENYVEFCAGVDDAGTYRIDVDLRTPSDRDNSFYVSVNGGPLVDFVAGVTGQAYGTDAVNDRGLDDPLRPGDFGSEQNEVLYEFEPGDHAIRFYLRRDGAQLDRITLTRVDEYYSFLEDCRSSEADGSIDAANDPPIRRLTYATQSGDSCRGVIGDGQFATTSGDFDVWTIGPSWYRQQLQIDLVGSDDSDFTPSAVIVDGTGAVLVGPDEPLVFDAAEPEYFLIVGSAGQTLLDPFDASSGTGAGEVGAYTLSVSSSVLPCEAVEDNGSIQTANRISGGCTGVIGDGPNATTTGDFDVWSLGPLETNPNDPGLLIRSRERVAIEIVNAQGQPVGDQRFGLLFPEAGQEYFVIVGPPSSRLTDPFDAASGSGPGTTADEPVEYELYFTFGE